LFDEAATRLQASRRPRVGRAEPERRWPVTLTVLVAIVLQLALGQDYAPPLPYLVPALAGVLLVAQIIVNPVRIERYSRPIRALSVALIVLISLANAFSAARLIDVMLTTGHLNAVQLLASAASIWATNVIAFALWYWEFDRGGPAQRAQGLSPYPDLLFPQMTAPELVRPGWDAQFADYLYLSFTNATAFSPTDVMPLARWAKLAMLAQSAVSLGLGALVIARAVNILKG
jgi:uncharacterized membrane protein